MEDCIFCKIVAKEIPSYTIYEDDTTLAFLDIFPAKQGQTIVIPKVHAHSSFAHADTTLATQTFQKAQQIAKILEEKLGASRIVLVIEGGEVPHLHLKLFPIYPADGEHLDMTPPDTMENGEKLKQIQSQILS